MRQKTQSQPGIPAKKWYHLHLFPKFAVMFLLVVALPVTIIAIQFAYQSKLSIARHAELLTKTVMPLVEKTIQGQQKGIEIVLDAAHRELISMSQSSLTNLEEQLIQEHTSLYTKNLEQLVHESQTIVRHKLLNLNKEIAREVRRRIDDFSTQAEQILHDAASALDVNAAQAGSSRQFSELLLSHEQVVHVGFVDASGRYLAQSYRETCDYVEHDPLFQIDEDALSRSLSGDIVLSGGMTTNGFASLRFSLPVRRNAGVQGVLTAVVTLSPLWEQIQARFFRHAALIYVVDAQGRRIYPLPDVPIPVETQEALHTVSTFREPEGTYDAGEAMMTFTHLPALHWKIVILQFMSSVDTRTASVQAMVTDYINDIEPLFHTVTAEEVKGIENEMAEYVDERKRQIRHDLQARQHSTQERIGRELTQHVHLIAGDVYQTSLWRLIPVILGSGVFAVLVGILVARRIIKPVKTVTGMAQDISKGNVTRSVPYVNAHDEIGLLSQSFHETIQYLQHIVTGAQKISEGDLSHRLRPVSEHDALGQAFSRMMAYLQEMAALASHIARGDLSQAVTPKSEADVLGNAVAGMTSYLQRIARFAGKVAQGDLSESLPTLSERDVLGHVFADMILRLRHLVSRIRAGANQLVNLSQETHSRAQEEAESVEKILLSVEETSSSMNQMNASIGEVGESMTYLASFVGESSSSIEELNSSIRQIVSHCEQLAAASEETSGSIQEISASLRQIAETAQYSKTLSDGATQDAQHGREAVEKMIQSMSAIEEMTRMTSTTIQRLDTRITSIERILEVIKDISDQTSLLSMNASIIAKKAGERGRGVNVIADKVRKLADQSHVSAKEIATIITDVRKESAHAVEVVSTGREQVQEGVILAEQAGKALDKIITGANQSSLVVSTIAKTTNEQTRISQYILQSMETVVEMVSQIQMATKEQEQSSTYIMNQTEQVLLLSQQVKHSTLEQGEAVKHVTLAMENIRAQVYKTADRTKEATEAASALLDHADALKHVVSQFII